MGARSGIINALRTELKKVDGSTPFKSDFHGNVHKNLKFWDEIDDFPYVCLVAGDEVREYLPSDFKWAFLDLSIKVYVKGEDPEELLENAFSDIEYVIDSNNNIEYDPNDSTKKTTDMRITTISTDEGLLRPLGVGDINIQIRYDL